MLVTFYAIFDCHLQEISVEIVSNYPFPLVKIEDSRRHEI